MSTLNISAHPSLHKQHKIGLDIARVAAIGLVIVSHYVSTVQFLGVFGVELFFALSGYLIGRILYKSLGPENRWSMAEVRNFWVRRWWRTLPNYYLFLVVFTVFHALHGGLPKLAAFSEYLLFFQDLLQAPDGFYDVSWSLAVEEWFYLLFPLSIFVFTKVGLGRRSSVAWTIALFLVVPPLLRMFALQIANPFEVRLMTLPRLDAIFYGVAVTFLVSRFSPGPRLRLTSLLASFAIVAFFLFRFATGSVSEDVFVAAYVLLPLGFAMSLPWLENVRDFSTGFPRLSTAISKISAWSFSIYLSHMPILFTIYWLAGDLRQSTIGNLISKIVALVLCILASKLIFEKFEKPLTDMRPASLGDKSRIESDGLQSPERGAGYLRAR